MANKNKKTNIKDERVEDATLYGEFISSFDQWMTLDRQRNNAENLENVTTKRKPDNEKKFSG